MARLHYRGKPKRRLYLANIGPDKLHPGLKIQAGEPLYGEDDSRAIGNIINHAEGENGELSLLLTTTEAGASAELHPGDHKGLTLRPRATPYPLPQ